MDKKDQICCWMLKDLNFILVLSSFSPTVHRLHQQSFRLWQIPAHEDAWSHPQMIYFRSSLSQLANFSAMHQQEVISCENIYLWGILLNHLHGVVQLSIWGVRWFGLGPPAVFKSYHSLHTLSSDKSMVLESKNPLSEWALSSTHCFFVKWQYLSVALSSTSLDTSISWGPNLNSLFFLFEAVLFMDTVVDTHLRGNLHRHGEVSDLSSISCTLSRVLIVVYLKAAACGQRENGRRRKQTCHGVLQRG